ncbi:MAG: hypothetical protein JJT94_01285 [Bernardetiaceae bacterium]|nr:hypothetical protein [Bernardetiaceae bacterium]
MVQPWRALLLLFYVMCIAVLIIALSPEELPLGKDTVMRVFSKNDINPSRKPPKKADINFIDELQAQVDEAAEKQADSEAKNTTQTTNDSIPEEQSELPKERPEPGNAPRQPIEYAENQPNTLDSFFQRLYKLSSKPELVRVVHYGDSQIEGDRITKYLRERMQNRFGGCGVGMLPIVARKGARATIGYNFSNNWKKYAYVDSENKPKHNQLGMLLQYNRFSKNTQAATDSTTQKTDYAWIKYYDNKLGYAKCKEIEQLRLLYKGNEAQIKLQIKLNKDSIAYQGELKPSAGADHLSIFRLPLKTKFSEIDIQFDVRGNPDFYAVSLDCNYGIAVDNIALRGSSGTEFSKQQRQIFSEQIQKMNVGLIIVQFGVNVVPNVLENYGFYERMMYQQLNYLRSLNPDACILVVGVSDMARKKGTEMQSYPNIPAVRDAQRRAAFRTGCAFWDLYEAMGGEGSMLAWVQNKPALAGRDYTHFNEKGANLVGEMLYNALMNEYDLYKEKNAYK